MKRILVVAIVFCSLALASCNNSSTCTPTSNNMTLTLTSTGNGTPGSFYSINDARQVKLCLVRGTAYMFSFQNASMHPFVFTHDPNGGPNAIMNNNEITTSQLPGYVQGGSCVTGCAASSFTITPGIDTPDSFYYECDVHNTGLGASVTVIDAPPAP